MAPRLAKGTLRVSGISILRCSVDSTCLVSIGSYTGFGTFSSFMVVVAGIRGIPKHFAGLGKRMPCTGGTKGW